MKFEPLLITNLIKKFTLASAFYLDFFVNNVSWLLKKTSFNWKVANYADSYWFMFNSKVVNHDSKLYKM